MGGGDAASDPPSAACGGSQLKKGKENPSSVQAAFLLTPESRSKPGSGGLIPWPKLLTQFYYDYSARDTVGLQGNIQSLSFVQEAHPGWDSC